MRIRTRLAAGLFSVTLAASVSQHALAQVVEGAQLGTEEEHTTLTLPEPEPHWVFVLDPVFPHLIASKIYLVDGDTQEYLGMVSSGYVPNLVPSPDGSAFYVLETYWSRGTRGERADVVTTYDTRTLSPTGEVILPHGRFLVVPKRQDADISPDGRYLYSFNMDPAMSISVVDVEEQTHLADIEIPGCSLVFPTGPMSFASICPDGSFLQVRFDEEGEAELDEGEPWFDAEEDPVFEHPAMHRPSGQAFFVSYEGQVYPVEFANDTATVGEAWSILDEADREESWRPGGWQLATWHAPTNRLFVLVHKGPRWTHKQAGEEIWVFDAESHERLERIPLAEHSISVSVTQDEEPLLFALSEAASMEVFDGTTYESKGHKEGIGDSPFVLQVFGE